MARFLFFFSLGAACSGTGEGESGWSSQEIALHTLPIIRVMTFQNITTSLKYYSSPLCCDYVYNTLLYYITLGEVRQKGLWYFGNMF